MVLHGDLEGFKLLRSIMYHHSFCQIQKMKSQTFYSFKHTLVIMIQVMDASIQVFIALSLWLCYSHGLGGEDIWRNSVCKRRVQICETKRNDELHHGLNLFADNT